jgi:biopolymer transport protein ExbD
MKRRPEETLEVPMSTLIDVVFLLIIFFIVTASVQRDVLDEKVKLAKSPHVEPDQSEASRLTISIRRGENGGIVYAMNGANVDLNTVSKRLERGFRQHHDDLRVVLRADKDLPYREVDRVGRAAARIGIKYLHHAGDPAGK